ncbi:MAG: poly-beta-1,6 N-acetyl-D-glucosamine export porin PgaA [Burkholderiaceae bacterium]
MKSLGQMLGLIMVLTLTSAPVFAVTNREYNALIKQARAGDYQSALLMLRERGQERPNDLRAKYDHLIVASWAGNTEEVIQVYETLGPSPKGVPPAAQEAIARAYRDTKQWDRALALYRDGNRHFPKRTAFSVGEVMTLADSGRSNEGVTLGKALVKHSPLDPDGHLALSYAYKMNNQLFLSLHEAERAHSLAPEKPYVTREYIYALQHAKLAEAALRTAKRFPNLLSAREMRVLEADRLAEMSRLATMPSRLEAERFSIADRALAEYDRLIPAWKNLGPSASADVLRLREDRILALNSRLRMRDAVNDYEALRAEGVIVPGYVLINVADAYLYLRQPEIARDLYRQAMTDNAIRHTDPNQHLDNQTGLFYSLVEGEDFSSAKKVITQASAEQPTWVYIKGLPQRVPNDLHLITEQTAALDLFYADDTVGAQQRLSELVDQAPRNTGLQVGLASVYRGRGWPRRSERQLKMAETLAPNSVQVIAGQGTTAMGLQEWHQAEILNTDLTARKPEERPTNELALMWQLHQKAELRITGSRGFTSNNPVSGNGDLNIETVLYSAPINYNWRVFGGVGYASGDFEEGKGHDRWLRTGVEWRGRDLTAEIEASTHNYGFGTKPGVRAMADYDLNDQWQVGASAELLSRETPLRALTNDISSNRAEVFVRWRENERREWKFSVAPSHFSDGNNRIEAQISGRERLYTSPRVKVDLGLNVSASHNSRENVPYFNPRADLEVLPTLTLTHMLYRHYDAELEQKFIVGAGIYTERGFGTGAIGALGYGILYRFSRAADVGVTVTGISRPFDGAREREVRVLLDMNFRF